MTNIDGYVLCFKCDGEECEFCDWRGYIEAFIAFWYEEDEV